MRIVYLGCGWTALFLGVLGVFLPLLPTTPFILLAAFCFSKGSEKMHSWILKHPRLGPSVTLWRQHGAIRKKHKVLAVIMIVTMFSITLVTVNVSTWVKVCLVLLELALIGFIWSRPSEIGENSAP